MFARKPLVFLLCAISKYTAAHLLRQESATNLSQWSRGPEADSHQVVQLSIALTLQDSDLGVETLLRISDPNFPEYGQHLSAKEVARIFQPKPNAAADVLDWLKESGVDLNHVNLSHGGDRLSLSLSVREATWLLQTTFYHHTHYKTGQGQIGCEYYHVPQSLSGSIDYILTSSPIQSHQQIPRQQIVLNDQSFAVGPTAPDCHSQTNPECLRDLYKIPIDVIPHPNNSFGIFEPSWISWISDDLDKFFQKYQKNLVGSRPKFDAINGGYWNETSPSFPLHQEPNLDFEYAMALTSPHEVTNVQVGSNVEQGNLEDMLVAFDQYYCDPINPEHKRFHGGKNLYPPGCNATTCDCGSSSPPKVLSISWGWTEAHFSPNFLHRQCLEFLKLGLMGTTVVVSISDDGTASQSGEFCIDDPSGNATAGRFSPVFPGSCPWVTSVGGTRLLLPGEPRPPASSTKETVWREPVHSSGGGFSNVFPVPPYQAPNIASYKNIEGDHLNEIHDRFNSTGRGFPDVAAVAHRYAVVSQGNDTLISGTSASNPVFASIITLINSERMHAGKGSVGFINPVLYSNPGVLNDVMTGSNKGCGIGQAFRATRGWDAVTGLGTPDYKRLRHLFMSLP
ncbi:hypothetical protein PFICI_01718 [Pestalotiopsis fici W106-1]|uniref:Peptidase S53 domain-containing protein n=1 Tax=Pestalotiopsis fici (strain W106-1 / CGMCC3.15140) TaxID=1229662 RepID=W3XPK2_PESFW|nr:uncharacterized protein PFICI_01718 [Pestalotiopsis fici W106-1]ETS87890.1 hypothetical protein PFICI_01718 [Pestalotiopsis fici W106-1]